MKTDKRITFLLFAGFLALAPLAGSLQCAEFDVPMERLAESLSFLKVADRSVVDQAVTLIRRGENTAALAQLSTLNRANPKNSSLRILTAYALLQVGNLVGAFEEAEKAESAPNGNSYKCWFLAKVAMLAGDRKVCRRELKHVKQAGDMVAEVTALEKELKGN